MNEELQQKLRDVLKFSDEQIQNLSDEYGVETEEDLQVLKEEDFIKLGFKLAKARKLVEMLKPAPAVPEKPTESVAHAAVPATPALLTPSIDVLPPVPDDASFLAMLKVGGELRIGAVEMIASVRAALADKSKLYELPKIILKKMKEFAEEQDIPVSPEFYKLRNLLTRRSYSEIFAALEIDSASVTQESKEVLLDRLRTYLWPAFSSFNDQLVSYMNMWQQGAANPGAMMMAMSAFMSGTPSPAAGIMQPPETSGLHDAAESVINNVNKVFAGEGIIISRALAYDANRIKEVLENPDLPKQIGATTRDQMLKTLGVDISADYVRLERNLVRFAMSIIEYPKVTAGQEEMAYLLALFQLGSAIPWNKLTEGGRPGAGSTFRDYNR
jgi:hypothetical protein